MVLYICYNSNNCYHYQLSFHVLTDLHHAAAAAPNDAASAYAAPPAAATSPFSRAAGMTH